MTSKRPPIGITMGDPVGIGPEIALLAFNDPSLHAICKPLLIGDYGILCSTKSAIGSRLSVNGIESVDEARYREGTVDVLIRSRLDAGGLVPGAPTAETGQAMIAYVNAAIDMAMEHQIGAVVTGPINKAAIKLAGYPFAGHTELLSQRTGSDPVVMMMAGERLRVALVTIHEPLRRVPDLLSVERICGTISVTHRALTERFGIKDPYLAVAGLNPHAGETGILGPEEGLIIEPAIERSRKAGYRIDGPFPPDTLFYLASKGRWDAIVCMYHDQGLIPFKMLHFEDGVNTTLGLPIIRTSVDHGTAYDIAGTGRADPGSLIAAIKMAATQVARLIKKETAKG